MNAIICGGVLVPIDCVVHTWLETGYHFTTRLRTQPLRAVINHATGAENPPERVFENMRSHRNKKTKKLEPLSVHFVVDALGEIYQMADGNARCSHCAEPKENPANSWSIGIEYICRMHADVPQRGIVRERVIDTIHNVRHSYDNLTAAQIVTAIRLNEALCRHYELPMRVPTTPKGEVYATVLPLGYLKTVKGCLAHLQLERGKPDPGLRVMRAIHARGLAIDSNNPPPRNVA